MAREDLRIIVRYIGQEIRDRIISLVQHPEMGHTGRPGMPDGLCELVVHPNYIVFYRLLTQTRTVEILRLKHAAQQVP